MQVIGLAGAHRVGKTTLAKTFASRRDFTFVETSVSAIFKDMGFDPAVTYDFSTRLNIQEEILKRLNAIYEKHACVDAITDRTPLDFMGYTLAEAIGTAVKEEDQARFAKYVAECFESLNKHFGMLLVVQPGIALVAEEGKAAMNQAYIEHLNSIILGLSVDERLKVPHYYVPRYLINLDDRVAALDAAGARVIKRAEGEREGAVMH
jgi:hypothetical protein